MIKVFNLSTGVWRDIDLDNPYDAVLQANIIDGVPLSKLDLDVGEYSVACNDWSALLNQDLIKIWKAKFYPRG